MFYVGQKVVCVDASGIKDGRHVEVFGELHLETESQLKSGGIYTIAWVGKDPETGISIVHVLERRRPAGIGYKLSRFRPLVERKTDISIFKAMLNPSKQGADA